MSKLQRGQQNRTYSSNLLSSSLNLRRASSFSCEFSFILPIMLSSLFLWAEWISWTIPYRNHRICVFINVTTDLGSLYGILTLIFDPSKTEVKPHKLKWLAHTISTKLCNDWCWKECRMHVSILFFIFLKAYWIIKVRYCPKFFF